MEQKKRGNPTWAKGKSGNENGRPVGSTNEISSIKIFQKYFDECEPGSRFSRFEEVMQITFRLARSGDMAAIKIIDEYKLGKPVQPISGAVNINQTSIGNIPLDKINASLKELNASN